MNTDHEAGQNVSQIENGFVEQSADFSATFKRLLWCLILNGALIISAPKIANVNAMKLFASFIVFNVEAMISKLVSSAMY